jgi:hypothetical protein
MAEERQGTVFWDCSKLRRRGQLMRGKSRLPGNVGTEPLVNPLPYLRKWLADESRFKIAMVARQCEKTKFMAAPEVVEDALRHESRGEKARRIILSRGERRALEAMEEGIKPGSAKLWRRCGSTRIGLGSQRRPKRVVSLSCAAILANFFSFL